MKTATAFAPGNISCLFRTVPDSDPTKAGSLGVGFTINKGVHASVSKADSTQVFFNRLEITFPTVVSVIQKLGTGSITVHLASDLPLGSGFGLSGASALATVYALNELLELHKDKLELAKLVHVAEVENGTGLGDVVNEYFGGFLLKTVPSSQFVVDRIPISHVPVYCKYFSKLSTKDILANTALKATIDTAGEKALREVQKLLRDNTVTFEKIITISKQFAIESGLLQDKQVLQTISEIESKGGHASMIMLGNAVLSDIPFAGATELTIC